MHPMTYENKRDKFYLDIVVFFSKIPRIQFAGEATHETFYSTVHGALESGIREGNRLLASIQMQTNN